MSLFPSCLGTPRCLFTSTETPEEPGEAIQAFEIFLKFSFIESFCVFSLAPAAAALW